MENDNKNNGDGVLIVILLLIFWPLILIFKVMAYSLGNILEIFIGSGPAVSRSSILRGEVSNSSNISDIFSNLEVSNQKKNMKNPSEISEEELEKWLD